VSTISVSLSRSLLSILVYLYRFTDWFTDSVDEEEAEKPEEEAPEVVKTRGDYYLKGVVHVRTFRTCGRPHRPWRGVRLVQKLQLYILHASI
jgi:hypothetical protein